jgi:hypothetical protein
MFRRLPLNLTGYRWPLPLPSTMVQTVVLCANGEHKTSKIADVTAAGIAKATRKVKQPAVLGTYTWGEQTLTLWGWAEGRAGTENKHELPPPHDKGLFFSDIIVVSSGGDLTVAAWKEFYDAAFKGFEDLGDEDTDSEGGAGEEDEDEDINGDGDDDVEAEEEGGDDDEEGGDGEGDGDGDGEGDDGSAAGSDDEDENEEEEGGDDDCYDSDDGGGGGKRRAPRRRAMAAPEYRRMDMGLRSKIKMPMQVGRRAPRWQTGPLLEPEP